MGKIVVNLDVEMAKRKMSLSELAERVGLTLANLSILKSSCPIEESRKRRLSDTSFSETI